MSYFSQDFSAVFAANIPYKRDEGFEIILLNGDGTVVNGKVTRTPTPQVLWQGSASLYPVNRQSSSTGRLGVSDDSLATEVAFLPPDAAEAAKTQAALLSYNGKYYSITRVNDNWQGFITLEVVNYDRS